MNQEQTVKQAPLCCARNAVTSIWPLAAVLAAFYGYCEAFSEVIDPPAVREQEVSAEVFSIEFIFAIASLLVALGIVSIMADMIPAWIESLIDDAARWPGERPDDVKNYVAERRTML